MKVAVAIHVDSKGIYSVRTLEQPFCSAEGQTREEALENMHDEIRYRLEYCPCAFTQDGLIELNVREE